MMLEGPKLGEFGSLLNVTAGLITSLWEGTLVLESLNIGDIGSLLNLQLAGYKLLS